MVQLIRRLGGSTFSSLQVRNYRLYYAGQAISISGTWMQSVAQAWLVLQLTNSGTALGLVAALQYLPVLVLGPWGGVIADRLPKRQLLCATQSAFAILALILGILVASGWVRLWMVAALALGSGLINVIDSPTSESFVVEVVGDTRLRNALALNSSLRSMARIIGPSIAAGLMVAVGLAPCFILNGLSYVAVVTMLLLMRASELQTPRPAPRGRGELVEGFRYVSSAPALRSILIILGIVGTFNYFSVSLPMVAESAFHGNAGSYAVLTAALGAGAAFGGLAIASRRTATFQELLFATLLFGLTVLLAATMPSLLSAAGALVVVGAFSVAVNSVGNTALQLQTAPHMRGRVMGFWAIVSVGSTAIGALIIGFIGQHAGAQWALATGGLAALMAAVYGAAAMRRH